MYNFPIVAFDVFGLSQSSTARNPSFPLVQLILTSQPWKYIEKEAGENYQY